MGSRKTRKPAEAEDHDPSTMLRENDRERFAHLRAGGMSLLPESWLLLPG